MSTTRSRYRGSFPLLHLRCRRLDQISDLVLRDFVETVIFRKNSRVLVCVAKMRVKRSCFNCDQASSYPQIDSIQKKFEPRV
jgi:hypothetical protein